MLIQGVSPHAMASTYNATPKASSSTPGSNSSSSSSSSSDPAGSMDTTFLSLLATELQSQDPTSPMDPTAMVGQMISLNELDQVIGIRQFLQNTLTTSTSTGSATAATGGK